MLNYDEISYAEIEDCIADAKEGNLGLYWQEYAEREFDSLRKPDGTLPVRAQDLHQELERILSVTKQTNIDE